MSKTNTYILLSVILAILLAVVLTVPQLRQFLTTQVAKDINLQKTVKITVPADAPPGEHTFFINVQDGETGDLLAVSELLTIVVEDTSGEDNAPGDEGNGDNGGGGNGGDSSSDSGGGGGGDSGTGGGHVPSTPTKTFAFSPERGHELSGNSASIVKDAGKVVVKLANSSDTLWKSLKVPTRNYWLYINVKHSTPKPIKMAIYINNKAWKVITLDKGDNQYRTHRVGLLRSFKGSKVSFRLVNNQKDNALFINSWSLSTNPNLKAIKAPSGKGSIKGTRVLGTHLLPRLNQIIREGLGKQFVVWDIWSYYAPRLVAPPSKRYAIGTEERLREVMRFWKIVRPQRPRGE